MIMLDNFIRPNSKKPLINLFDLIKESFAFANKLGETVSESYNDPYDAVKNRKPNKKELCIVFDNKVICILDTKMISVKWAVSCAKHVLHIFEEQYPDDKRPRKAIEAASNWIKDPSEKNRIRCKDAANAASVASVLILLLLIIIQMLLILSPVLLLIILLLMLLRLFSMLNMLP